MVIIGGLRFPCVVQWVRLCVSNAGGVGSIPGQGTKIPHVCLTVGEKEKKKLYSLKKKKGGGGGRVLPELTP